MFFLPKNDKYFHVKELIKLCPDADEFVIWSERSDGKSYSLKELCIENFFRKGERAMFLKRFRDDWSKNVASDYFKDMSEVIKKESGGEWTGVLYQKARWWLTRETEDGEIEVGDFIADCRALTEAEKSKAANFPTTTTLVLEEFMLENPYGYFNGEYAALSTWASTIARRRGNLKVFMLGNSVDKYCPIFEEMKIGDASTLKNGEAKLYEYSDPNDSNFKLKVLCYHGFPTKGGKSSDKYALVDLQRYNMTSRGEWLVGEYPEMKQEYNYKPCDVLRKIYIEFKNDKLICDIVNKNDITYMFIYRNKHIEKQYKDDDIVITDVLSFKNNYINNIYMSNLKICKIIMQLLKNNYVLYQNNTVGSIFDGLLAKMKRDF